MRYLPLLKIRIHGCEASFIFTFFINKIPDVYRGFRLDSRIIQQFEQIRHQFWSVQKSRYLPHRKF